MEIAEYFNQVLLNREAQDAWIDAVDIAFLNMLLVVGTLYIEDDDVISKTIALQMGAVFGGVYECLKRPWR